MKYPTSPGWYELNDTTEYDGSAVRVKPSYMTTSEFKAKLDSHRSEVLKEIRRNGGQVSHTPWTQEQVEKWAMESDVVRKATFEDDAIEGFKAGMAKAAEMIKERIVAEKDAEIERLKRERAKYEADCKRIEYFDDLHEKVATQARVIEKLKLAITDIANKNTCWRLYEIDKYKSYEDGWEGVAEFAGKVLNELAAIEKEGAKDEPNQR